MSDAGPSEPPRADPALRPRERGKLLSEITNRIVSLMREHDGRGPIKAKTYVLYNLIVCVLSDGFTAIERTMIEGGEPERVLEMRRDFQRMMKDRYSKLIEELTGRKVLAVLSQAHVKPDLTFEMFLMAGRGLDLETIAWLPTYLTAGYDANAAVCGPAASAAACTMKFVPLERDQTAIALS